MIIIEIPLSLGSNVTTLVLSPSPIFVDAVNQNWWVAASCSRTVSCDSVFGDKILLCVPSWKFLYQF